MNASDSINHVPVVLYVEDDDTTRNSAAMLLRRKYPDFILMTAENGEAGLEKFRNCTPDIVITDISMPVMDGIRMIREIRAIDPQVPIIITSASADAEQIAAAVDIDARFWVHKPIEVKTLFKAIDECIGLGVPGEGLRANG